jgi:hypothetical protein
MSHFTKVKTNITEKAVLIKTLDNLKLNWSKKKLLSSEYNSEKHYCDVIIKQQNNHEIGFALKTNSYELVYDEMFWNLGLTISSFTEKINTYYALNLITNNLSKNGFRINKLTEENEFGKIKIKINALRYN